ncbi:zinc-binding dehydrogenase [Hydrogenoanaerobacterium sp.]|uniref:zinc-binding dehydrogenase n=1 Tax=Hydrogenoanaerobacterium sp. TaxID=2953763 RepID=UPI00289E499A|nr:zinc-binding dehydrogenase [Hydrogenoanaerobacterium sp.]
MKTKAVRMYGANDLRLEEFELPEIKEDEILVRIISDSICMSTNKLLTQGKAHKRAPQNIDTNPIIIGHEFAGEIVQVGEKWKNEFKPGEKFAQQPALNYKGSLASPGYSYEFFGGAATYCIIPQEVMELGCLLHYDGDAYFDASLGEPMSCIIGGYHIMYHTNKTNYDHAMDIKEGGNVLILGGCGPMGLGAIEYPLVTDRKPAQIVVTDVDNARISRAKELISSEFAQQHGVQLTYFNPQESNDQYKELLELSNGKGYDDVFVYAPIRELAELGDKLIAFDGCLNFFAGPSDPNFTALVNLYNCHYTSTHILGSTGGNTNDLKEALRLSAQKKLRPAVMVSHICGINAIADTTANLPNIRAGKILGYTQIDLPLTALDDFEELGKTNPLFASLHTSCQKHSGLWNTEAECILLDYFGVERS